MLRQWPHIKVGSQAVVEGTLVLVLGKDIRNHEHERREMQGPGAVKDNVLNVSMPYRPEIAEYAPLQMLGYHQPGMPALSPLAENRSTFSMVRQSVACE